MKTKCTFTPTKKGPKFITFKEMLESRGVYREVMGDDGYRFVITEYGAFVVSENAFQLIEPGSWDNDTEVVLCGDTVVVEFQN